MTSEGAALTAALQLMHMPSRVRTMRTMPLPEGIGLLMQLANDDNDAKKFAAEVSKRPPDVARKAAEFFLEQILLSPESDSYRILGATPEASTEELRRNMALMLRWLHPDLETAGERAVFAKRVTLAWQDLKTSDKRAAYDRERKRLAETPPVPERRPRGAGVRRLRPEEQAVQAAVSLDSGPPHSMWRRILFRLMKR